MPELPEVETVRRGLERELVGQTITQTSVQLPKILRPPSDTPELFAKNLQDCLIKSVDRRGKYLILSLDKGYSLAAHLKMRGHMRVNDAAKFDTNRYLCATISLSDGRQLRYYDAWAWGELRVYPGGLDQAGEFINAVSKMGPEPLSEDFSPTTLITAGKTGTGRSVKALLLDQSVVAGIGNIYADESLFKAGINPASIAGLITESDWKKLHRSVVQTLSEAVDLGGTESDNFFDIYGSPGRYKPKVYGRAGQKCVECGTKLSRIKVCGRGTVFCEHCQPVIQS